MVYPKIYGLFSPEESIYLDNYFNSSDWDLLEGVTVVDPTIAEP